MIVSHVHPSTVEGHTLMSEVMVPGLQESASAGGEEFFWSVDVHCDSSGGSDSGSGSESDGGGGGDRGCGGGGSGDGDGCCGDGGHGGDSGGCGHGGGGTHGDGERSGGEQEDKAVEEEKDSGGGDGDNDSLGPSVYMAKKVRKRGSIYENTLEEAQFT